MLKNTVPISAPRSSTISHSKPSAHTSTHSATNLVCKRIHTPDPHIAFMNHFHAPVSGTENRPQISKKKRCGKEITYLAQLKPVCRYFNPVNLATVRKVSNHGKRIVASPNASSVHTQTSTHHQINHSFNSVQKKFATALPPNTALPECSIGKITRLHSSMSLK